MASIWIVSLATSSWHLGSGRVKRLFSTNSSNNTQSAFTEKQYLHCCRSCSEGHLSSHFSLGTAWYKTWETTGAALFDVPGLDEITSLEEWESRV